MNDSDILTTVLNNERLLCEIITEYRHKIRITAKMHKGQVRTIIDFAPEILAGALYKEDTDE